MKNKFLIKINKYVNRIFRFKIYKNKINNN